MLGRLFNNRSNEQLNSHQNSSINICHTMNNMNSLNTGNNIIEDLNSRTILYGTSNPILPININLSKFRLFIIQDKGELMVKNNFKIYYDSNITTTNNGTTTNKNKIDYNIFQFLEIMFGNSIHHDFQSNETIKIHNLESLQFTLISKHFNIKLSNQKKNLKFAIGLIIPCSIDLISTTITPNWQTIIHYLSIFQSIFIKNHLLNYNNYLDISIFYKNFIKNLKNLIITPRLLPGLNFINNNFFLKKWCFEINNWIEIKDGSKPCLVNGSKFLLTLLTIIQTVKYQLINNNSDEFIRIIIMASNSMVATKLIFILNGILPFNLKINQLNDGNIELKRDTTTTTTTNPISTGTHNDNQYHPPSPPTPHPMKKGWEIPKTPSKSITTPSLMTPCKSLIIQPNSSTNSSIPTSNSMSYLSSSLSSSSTNSSSTIFSNSLTRGFQYLQNWKNSTNNGNTGDVISSGSSFKTPSPGLEYDDYPWNSNHNGSINNNISNGYSTGSNMNTMNNNSIKFKKIELNSLNIKRSTTTLFKINNNISKNGIEGKDKFSQEFNDLMNSDIDYNYNYDSSKSVSILEIPFDDEDQEDSEDKDYDYKKLPKLCGYVQDYLPDFHIQACPNSQDLESKIISSMKNSLTQFNKSKTFLISLRIREIKEIQLTKNDEKRYTSSIRKIYYNSKPNLNYLNQDNYTKIEILFEKIRNLFKQDENDEEINKIRDYLKNL
ncbi:hypothetical protein BN7_2021 [Wickerhamomyces ciferrii]|uniref:Protein LST4 n=1 Tax=Wickerhamomyces ciferrii (strain ATCC 14091 / BCRC 22168 / CBS 111 / JCM 3599 / NBRC 0793 / NRRL Y-1031 F-60-10) TaxID=1206466 RepID=K0KHI5_WICCF|nr:uncharacterized protein BN7_2021 [Wickerhamomyces ciferrii]CCH42476.1 hypothetical protein BN7_2021 [Wickerhamomyces ciferrii]